MPAVESTLHNNLFVHDFSIVLMVAGVVSVLFHRFRQPVLLGYLVAGVLIGPHLFEPGLITEKETVHSMADLGVIFLMFTLGLHFSFRKLRTIGGVSLAIGLIEVPLTFVAGFVVGKYFGWKTVDAIFMGAALCISSTILMFKTLNDLGKINEPFAKTIFGVAIVEDMMAIALLALLPGLALSGSLEVRNLIEVIGKLAGFFVAVVVMGLLFAPKLVDYLDRFERQDVLLISVLGLCFGVSFLALKLEYSVALGAFLSGAVIAESKAVEKITFITRPIADLFSGLFFVAIGMLIEPRYLLQHGFTAFLILVVFLVVKIGSASFAAIVAGERPQEALRVGVSLGQIGEFSFVIAALGLQMHVTSAHLYPMIIAISAAAMFVSPYLLKHADLFIDSSWHRLPKWLLDWFEIYRRWLKKIQTTSSIQQQAMRSLIHKMLEQLALNAALITAVFLFAAYGLKTSSDWLPQLAWLEEWKRTLFWWGAMMAALPLLVATYRKLQALSMLVAELSMQNAPARMPVNIMRSFVSRAFMITGLLILIFWTALMSSALLPPWRILVVMSSVVVAIGFIFRQHFIRIYARAQLSIVETLDAPLSEAAPHEDSLKLPSLIRGADVQVISLSERSWATDRDLRELQLRTRTGASIIAIERANQSIVNPDPDEKLVSGDRILLIGSKSQIASARHFLKGGELV